jgi:phage-related minor tail protein
MVEQLSTDATTEQRLELMKLAEVMKTNVADAIDADIAKQNELNASWEVGATTALETYMKNVSNVADQTNKVMTGAFQGMEDALVNFVKTGKLDFSSLADSIISDLLRIAVRQSITVPLANMLFGSGSSGGIFDLMSSFGGRFFADGGSPPVGVPSIVGENGPEIFVPSAAGTIIPNGQIGGNSQTINVNISAAVGDIASKSDVVAGMRATANQIAAQLSRSQHYGGAMA